MSLIMNNSNVYILMIKLNNGETINFRAEFSSYEELCHVLRHPVVLFEPNKRKKDAHPFILLTNNISKIDISPAQSTNFHNEQVVHLMRGY